MSITDLSINLENVVHTLGFEDVKTFVMQQSKDLLIKKNATCDEKISLFESKYGYKHESFLANFHEITQVSLFEKEDDEMFWSTQIELREHYISLLKNISE